MIKLDQKPGNYYLRFATYPSGDMQQVLEGQAIVSYSVSEQPHLFFIHINILRRQIERIILHQMLRWTQHPFGC